MSDFGKGWPLCLQPLPLTSSFRNVLTQNRSSSCSALVLSRCGLSPRLAFLSSSPSVHFEALAPGFPPQLPCWSHSSPSLWKRHLLWLWGHCPLLVCFCLVSYLLSSTSSSFSAHVSVLQGTTSFSFPHCPLEPSHVHDRFWPWCSQPIALGISQSDPPRKHLTCWISLLGGSIGPKEPVFVFSQSLLFHFPPSREMTSLPPYLPKPGTWESSLEISSFLPYSSEQWSHFSSWYFAAHLPTLFRYCCCGEVHSTCVLVAFSVWFSCSLISSPVNAFHSEWFFLHVNLIMLSLCSKFFSGSSQPVDHERSTIRSSWRVRTHRSGNIPHPLARNLPISSFCLLLSSLLSSSSDEGLLVPKQAELFDTWEPLIMKLLPLPRSLCPCFYPPPTQSGLHLLIVQGSAMGPSS